MQKADRGGDAIEYAKRFKPAIIYIATLLGCPTAFGSQRANDGNDEALWKRTVGSERHRTCLEMPSFEESKIT
jgi:hypothetical protein